MRNNCPHQGKTKRRQDLALLGLLLQLRWCTLNVSSLSPNKSQTSLDGGDGVIKLLSGVNMHLEKHGRVYLLTLTGSDEHRLNPTTLGSIRSALAQVRADSGGRGAALVTAAEGKFFSNGLDLAWARVSPSDRTRELGSALRATIADLMSLPMPTIAAVTGHAAAGGFIIARAHDYVVMRGDRGFVYMSELDIGVPIARYTMSVLRSRITDARALRDLLLRSEKMKAGEAERKGVIDRAVEGGAEETVAVAVRMAEEMAAKGWDGGIYASMRKGAFPQVFRDLGLAEDTDEDISRVFISKI